MKKIITALMILLTLVQSVYAESYRVSQKLITQLLEQQLNGFSGLEHNSLGEQINLRFYISNPEKLLHLPNGLMLTYGQIVMMAGDLIGDPHYPVSICPEAKREACFNLQFNALAGEQDNKKHPGLKTQVQNIINYHEEIEQLLTEWRSQGKTDPEFYKKYGSIINKKLNRLTGGGSVVSDYIPFGNYLKLSAVNFDHFQPDSLTTYTVGHQVALNTALSAYQQKQQGNIKNAEQLLELAYAQNAFANHFLSDSFSSGHIRTPRRELYKQVNLPSILSLLIANLMHDEDNLLGLNVVNEEGTSWTAYGDNYLFTSEAELHRIILIQAMQRSADSIYNAFESGKTPEHFTELKLVPLLKEVEQLKQASPLFKVDTNGVLLKRKENYDPYNYEWTDNWSGLITLLEFNRGI